MRGLLYLFLLPLTYSTASEEPPNNEVGDNCPDYKMECIQVSEEECGVCHSMYMRECNIRMEYTYTPVKVRECKEQLCSKLGYTRKCTTKYYSHCTTKLVYREMEEDYPACAVEKQERCKKDTGC